MDIKTFHFDVTDSTNRLARDYVNEGGTLPALFTADEQTKGRGRLGRSFYSPKNSGLYMTLAIPFSKSISDGVALTVAVSVAVARVLSPLTEKNISIKWVNDILADGRKVAGILCEAVGGAVLIGIGINLSTEDFPEEIKDTASSLGVKNIDKRKLAEDISYEIIKILDAESSNILEEYKTLSAVLGQEIYYIKNNERFEARALDIDETGGLIVENSNSTKTTLTSGEITVRIKPE